MTRHGRRATRTFCQPSVLRLHPRFPTLALQFCSCSVRWGRFFHCSRFFKTGASGGKVIMPTIRLPPLVSLALEKRGGWRPVTVPPLIRNNELGNDRSD